ncbi:hypothetical protein PtrM4_026260 [Pyrenophora tritici-repentis]|uniref:Heterokaryon incompatibility protein n=1 Tax=Pyrenophora tritici-repentis TaxID=45151 RepID=A0A834SAM9_9PLEO|nr:hypothetical protein PtrM4_026260 [Pyrenophora tritici-repentis]KAI1517918.1 Heterokaryon incompatibility protein [Pyrenophora tritici-repentis]
MVSTWLHTLTPPKATLENSTITAYLQAGDNRDHEELASSGTARIYFFCFDFCVDPELVEPPESQFQIRLRADMSDSQQSRMQLRARDDFYGRSSISVSNEFADSTQHVSCFQQIQRWLEVCLRDHPSCRTTLDPDSHEKLPTRLIDACENQPRLILSAELENTPIQKRLDVASFPPTFRDAIEATIRLGFRYIWIDALCIIQDDVQNWKQGAASMAMVYRNAVCNLGAHAAAADPEFVGLFVRRDPEQMQIPFLKIQSLDWEGNYWADPLVEPKRLSSSPLMQRG